MRTYVKTREEGDLSFTMSQKEPLYPLSCFLMGISHNKKKRNLYVTGMANMKINSSVQNFEWNCDTVAVGCGEWGRRRNKGGVSSVLPWGARWTVMDSRGRVNIGSRMTAFIDIPNQTTQECHKANTNSAHLHTLHICEIKTKSEAKKNGHGGKDVHGVGSHLRDRNLEKDLFSLLSEWQLHDPWSVR